jgi:hypothetical protein
MPPVPLGVSALLRAKLSPLGNVHGRERSLGHRIAARVRRPLDRLYLAHAGQLRALARLGASCHGAAPAAPPGPRVLVLALRAFPSHAAIETVIAQALRLRGAEVALLTCGGGQPVCEMGWSRRAWPRPCDRCAHYTGRLTADSGLRSYRLADRMGWGPNGRRAPVSVSGEEAPPPAFTAASLAWFLQTSHVDDVPEGAAAAADYSVAAAGVERAAASVLDDFRPDVVFMLNGLFASERVVRELALARGLRAPTYELTARAGALHVSQDSPAPKYDTDRVWEEARDRPLDPEQEAALDRLLEDRAGGVGAHERYYDSVEADARRLRKRLDLPADRRVTSLFTSMSWDTAYERDAALGTMVDWVETVVRAAARCPDTVLVIRIHPAERRWGSRDDVEGQIRGRFEPLPPNVRFVRPEDPISSYALLLLSDRVLTYASTLGVEAAARGVPTAVAGRVHYRGRGFTWDVDAPADVEAFVAEPSLAMTPEQAALARRYAFTFFFRLSVPFPSVPTYGGKALSVPESAEALAPGSDPYLDLVCERILDGGDFHVPDELALRAPAAVTG